MGGGGRQVEAVFTSPVSQVAAILECGG